MQTMGWPSVNRATRLVCSFRSTLPPFSQLSCICNEGNFRKLGKQFFPLAGVCVPCLEVSAEGTDCKDVGLTTETLTLLPGFWRSSNTSTEIVQCASEDECVQVQAFNKTQQCIEGHDGPICENCLPKWSRSGVNGNCAQCPENAASGEAVLNYVIVVSVPCAMAIAVYICFRKRQIARAARKERRGKHTKRGSNAVVSVYSEDMREFRENNEKHWTSQLRTKVKILSSSFQIVAEFGSTLRITFPPVFVAFGNWIKGERAKDCGLNGLN